MADPNTTKVAAKKPPPLSEKIIRMLEDTAVKYHAGGDHKIVQAEFRGALVAVRSITELSEGHKAVTACVADEILDLEISNEDPAVNDFLDWVKSEQERCADESKKPRYTEELLWSSAAVEAGGCAPPIVAVSDEVPTDKELDETDIPAGRGA